MHLESQSQFQPPQHYSTPSITRYFDHIQNQEPIRTAVEPFAPVFGVVYFDFDNAPALERQTEPPKKKEKKPTPAPSSTPVAPAAETEEVKSQAQEKETKKEKKEKKQDAGKQEDGKKNKGGKVAPVAEDAGEPVPSMIDLRVGHIVDGGSFSSHVMGGAISFFQ